MHILHTHQCSMYPSSLARVVPTKPRSSISSVYSSWVITYARVLTAALALFTLPQQSFKLVYPRVLVASLGLWVIFAYINSLKYNREKKKKIEIPQ